MSNIVIDESRILQLEEDRVTLRNNLRSQGIACADDEVIESLIDKVEDLQSWAKYLDKTISGVLYDSNITSVTSSQFRYFTQMKGVNLPSVSTFSGDYAFADCGSNEFVYLKNLANCGNAAFQNNTALKSFTAPKLTTATFGNYIFSNDLAIRFADIGTVPSINGKIGDSQLKYLIMRKADNNTSLSNASHINTNSLKFVPSALISTYQSATNWSTQVGDFISLEDSRFENLDWWETVYNTNGTAKNTCTLDGNLIETADNETVAIFKHTENIEHVYENGVELADTDLVAGKTLTTTV